MENSIFLSKGTVFSGDCACDLHSSRHEPAQRMHYHDFYELMIYFGDKATLVTQSGTYPVRQGDLVFISMFTPHLMLPEWSGEKDCFMTVHANPELLIAFSMPGANLPDMFSKDTNPVHALGKTAFQKYWRMLEEYHMVHDKAGKTLLIKAIVYQLMAYAYSDCFSSMRCTSEISRDMTVITRIIHYINAHLTERFSLQALASEINYSESYVCHLFKAATNKTISNYIQEKRIEMATGLLAQSTPINKAAEQAGFRNYSHFYKSFKRQMGCNPAEYRVRLEEEAAHLAARSAGRAD